MGSFLAHKAEIQGISRNKIILVTTIITLVIGVILLLGMFDNTGNNNTPSNDYHQNVKFDSTDNINSTTQILDQVKHKKKQLLEASISRNKNSNKIANESHVIIRHSNSVNVPPIVTIKTATGINHKTPKPNLAKQKFDQQREDNQFSSYSAKSLMFSKKIGINSKRNNSHAIATTNITPFGLHKPLGANYHSDSFANQEKESSNLDDNKRTVVSTNVKVPKSPYELKAGSVIPATMISGINSDLPGTVVAQVRENVYDSVRRRFLLIPQGAKLIGVYDSHVTYGQERLVVAWKRLIYPNGNSVNLKSIPGSDLEGYSGFHDLVDNKYWKIFGTSFIIGVITAGMQYSQNNTNPNVQVGGLGFDPNPSVGQTVAGSLGQQMGQTGLAVAQKNLNVAPTLIIRPNYPFNIMLTGDLILKPIKSQGF